jgi:hypothetical protein
MTLSSEIGFFLVLGITGYILISDLRQYYAQVWLVRAFLLRGVAICAAAALHSLAIQLPGLLGENGLQPITTTLKVL